MLGVIDEEVSLDAAVKQPESPAASPLKDPGNPDDEDEAVAGDEQEAEEIKAALEASMEDASKEGEERGRWDALVRSEDQRCAAPGEGRQRLPALVKEWYAEGKFRRDEEKRREDQKEANLDVALKFNALLQKVIEKAPDAEELAVSAAVMVWIVKEGREEIGSDLMKASAVELTGWEMGHRRGLKRAEEMLRRFHPLMLGEEELERALLSMMNDEDWRRYFGALAVEIVEEGVKGGGESGVKEGGGESGVKEGGGGERPGVESGPALAEREEVGD